MALFKNKRIPTVFEVFRIPLEHSHCCFARIDGQPIFAFCEGGARDEPGEVNGIGHRGDFVEVIDAPDQPTLGIAPSSEILDMEIPHPQHPGCLGEVRAHISPQRSPPIEGRSQKREERGRNLFVFQLEIRFDDSDVLFEPTLIVDSCRDNRFFRLTTPVR